MAISALCTVPPLPATKFGVAATAILNVRSWFPKLTGGVFWVRFPAWMVVADDELEMELEPQADAPDAFIGIKSFSENTMCSAGRKAPTGSILRLGPECSDHILKCIPSGAIAPRQVNAGSSTPTPAYV